MYVYTPERRDADTMIDSGSTIIRYFASSLKVPRIFFTFAKRDILRQRHTLLATQFSVSKRKKWKLTPRLTVNMSARCNHDDGKNGEFFIFPLYYVLQGTR